MSNSPFGYNPGSLISGTTQYGTLVSGNVDVEYSTDYGGIKWWMGPEDVSGYVIGTSVPSGNQPIPIGVTGFGTVQFWRTKTKTDQDFLNLANYIGNKNGQPPFANTNDAEIWLELNGYYTSFNLPTPTPTATSQSTPTPTPTGTPASTPGETPTLTPTPTGTPASTPGETPTLTPTPSTSPIPVTGYPFNLIALPYNFPTSGNSIMNNAGGITSGSTDVNVLATGGRGFYLNATDSNGVDRTNYFSGFTGQSVTITLTQTGSTAIYSGDTNSFKFWSANAGSGATPSTGFVFGAGIGVPPSGTPSGAAVLIQSATTLFTIGLPVYVSVVNNNPLVTPTPTATSVTPTPTPTQGVVGDFNVTVSQQGPDVLWSGSGSFNLGALSLLGSQNISAGLSATQAIWAIGPSATIEQYGGASLTYPTSFGPGGAGVAPTSSGSTFGIIPGGASGRMLLVPSGYTSNTFISGATNYANTTISGMGLSGGTYTWSWGSGGNASSLVMNIIP